MTKFEEEFNYLIELSGKVLIGQVDAEAFEKNRVSFFEKYETDQQQALPEVPEFVAEGIESIPRHYSAFGAISLIKDKIKSFPEGNEDWLPVYNWLVEDIKNQDIFALAFITGKYTVQKPKRFYLKNKLTTSYLVLYTKTGYYEHWQEPDNSILAKNRGYKTSFTQEEIDKMEDTGSYEKIEVEE